MSTLRFSILSLFPDYFQGPLDQSLIGRAREEGLILVDHVNIRDFAENKHQRVDDRPYGGGPGMVLMPGPVAKAIRSVRESGSRVIYLTPAGAPLSAGKCRSLAEQKEHIVLLCGHYEGVDQRAIKSDVDEEISIGDYVLTNGCPAALVLIDAVSRFVPGVIGHEEAAMLDSFEQEGFDYPCYTRPQEFEGQKVPDTLLSGDHQRIATWRRKAAYQATKIVRPELLKGERK